MGADDFDGFDALEGACCVGAFARGAGELRGTEMRWLGALARGAGLIRGAGPGLTCWLGALTRGVPCEVGSFTRGCGAASLGRAPGVRRIGA